jgi:hypothetical protein
MRGHMGSATLHAFGRVVGESMTLIRYGADKKVRTVGIPTHPAARVNLLCFVGTHWFDLKTIQSGNDGV